MAVDAPTIVLETAPLEWDGLLTEFPERTVFHGTAWLKSVESAYGPRLHLLRAEREGKTVAVWPAFLQRKGPFRVLGSPLPGWGTVYGGPLFRSRGADEAAIRAFLTTRPCRRVSFAFLKVRDPGDEVDLTPFGYRKGRRYATYVLDLRPSEDELFRNLEGRCRNLVRKGRKAGFEIREERDGGFLDDYWGMSEEVYGRSGETPNFSRSFLDHAFRNLSEKGQVLALSAFLEGERAASLFLPHDDRTAYYWGGASLLRYRKLAPNNLLQWEAIRRLRERGIASYDMVSVYGGPGKFKRSFGPSERETSTSWEYASGALVRWLRRLYERYARSRRVLRKGGPETIGSG